MTPEQALDTVHAAIADYALTLVQTSSAWQRIARILADPAHIPPPNASPAQRGCVAASLLAALAAAHHEAER